jgi:hypothetical protein
MTLHRSFGFLSAALCLWALGCGGDDGATPPPGGGMRIRCGAMTCTAGSMCCLDCDGIGVCVAGATGCPRLMCEADPDSGPGPGPGPRPDAGTTMPTPDGSVPPGTMDEPDASSTMPPGPMDTRCGDRASCGPGEECCTFGEGSGFGGDSFEICTPVGVCEERGGMPGGGGDPGDPEDPPPDPEDPPPSGGMRCEARPDGTSTCPMGQVCCTGFGGVGTAGICTDPDVCPREGGSGGDPGDDDDREP